MVRNLVPGMLAAVFCAVVFGGPAGALPLPDAGKEFKDCSDCPAMISIPPGIFTMGAPDAERGHGPDEHPQHQVNIAYKFAVGKYEVTREEYQRFSDETTRPVSTDPCFTMESGKWEATKDRNWQNPGFKQTTKDPVVCILHEDAEAYAQWLSAKTGQKYRLLSEAEFEYVARAGTKTPWYWGDNPDLACQYTNVPDLDSQKSVPSFLEVTRCHDGYAYTAPVGKFKPNPFGLYDILGNVWEKIDDCTVDTYTNAPTDGSAYKGGDCKLRDMRGGAWKCVQACDMAHSNAPLQILPSVSIRAANRDRTADRLTSSGFRVARSE